MNPNCRYFLNQEAMRFSSRVHVPIFTPAIREFHRQLPGYDPTPLLNMKELAASMGLKSVLLKDESKRFEMGAFKALGASWAMHCILQQTEGPHTFCTATDGNHGRAVAWSARIMNQKAVVFVPEGTSESRISNIRNEGALLQVVEGNYDHTVKTAQETAERNNYILIQDTSWEGYREIPKMISDGYTTMMYEIEEQAWLQNIPGYDAVILQSGVGSWAASVAMFLYKHFGAKRPYIIVAEPSESDCLLESALAGHICPTRGSQKTIMAGLNCGTPSLDAWLILKDLADAFISIPDHYAIEAVKRLSVPELPGQKVETCESGAAGLGALFAIMHDRALRPVKDAIQAGRQGSFLIFNTEGTTDPVMLKRIIQNELNPGRHGI